MLFLTLFLIFLILSSGSLLAAAVSGRRFEETLPLTCGGIPVLLFFGGLAFGLQAAFFLALAAAAGMLVFSIVYLARRHAWREMASSFLTPGFLLFTLFFAALVWIHKGRLATGFDEFSHWMDVVKAMTALDDFGTNPEAHILFQSYPPGMALFEYFFQKIHLLVNPGAGFTEWLCYPAYQLYAFSFFFPLLKNLTWKQTIPAAFLSALLFLSPLALYDYALTQTYIDPFLGMITGAGLCFLYTQKEKDILSDAVFLLLLFALVMAKDTGLYCACVLGIAACVVRGIRLRQGKSIEQDNKQKKQDDQNKQNKQNKQKMQDKHNKQIYAFILFALLTILTILLPKLLWKAHYTAAGYGKSFSQPIDWQVIGEVLTGRSTSWHGNAFGYYLNALWTSPVEIGSTGIRITYPILLAAEAAVLFLLVFLRRKEKGNCLRLTIAIFAFLMTLLYSFGLGFIYLFKFGEGGTLNLLSFDRYLRVPYLALLVMIFSLLLQIWISAQQKQKWIWLPLLCAAGIALLPLEKTVSILNRNSVREAKAFRAPYDALAEQVLEDAEAKAKANAIEDAGANEKTNEKSNQKTEHPRTFIISQHDGGWDYYTLRYCLRPCVSTGWTLASEGSEEGLIPMTPEEWEEQLKEYDYVVIYRTDEPFTEQYGSLFANYADFSEPVSPKTAYRVDHEQEKLVKLGIKPEEILEDPLKYRPGQTLWFTSPETAPEQLMTSGFSSSENGFTWTDGTETILTLKPDVPEGTDLTATLTYLHVNGFQWCEIEAGNKWVFGDELPESLKEITFQIPATSIDENGTLTLCFRFPNASEPGNGDLRQLAVAFESLTIQVNPIE